MEHIVQFAVGIDDEAIKKRIMETAHNQIISGEGNGDGGAGQWLN